MPGLLVCWEIPQCLLIACCCLKDWCVAGNGTGALALGEMQQCCAGVQLLPIKPEVSSQYWGNAIEFAQNTVV